MSDSLLGIALVDPGIQSREWQGWRISRGRIFPLNHNTNSLHLNLQVALISVLAQGPSSWVQLVPKHVLLT